MNVTETVKQIITDCPLMDEFNNGVHIDYTEAKDNEAGMFPIGPTKIGEDLIGNEKYKMTYQFYAGLCAYEDAERLSNSDFLTKLTYYLNKQKDIAIIETVDSQDRAGTIKKIDAANALVFDVPTGDINDGVRYQLQLSVNYIIKSNDGI
jgi:hypothetical protein